MGFIKLGLSFLIVGLMEYSMRNDDEWNADKRTQYTFEIAASVLCAGWIVHNGW